MKHRSSPVVRGVAVCLAAAIGFGAVVSIATAEEPIGPATRPGLKPGPNPDKPKRGGGELIGPIGVVTPPATLPSAKKEEKQAEVSPEVRSILDSVRDAYAKLKTLRVEGTITGEMDLNGEQQTHLAQFAGAFMSPLSFRHTLMEQVPDKNGQAKLVEQMTIGGTGKKLYIFEPAYKYYYLADNPKERNVKEIGRQVGGSLEQQNLSLLLAIMKDASAELLEGVEKVEKVDDVTLDGDACPSLRFTAEGQPAMTVSFDPKTHLVRQVQWDHKSYAQAHKQQDVKKALVTVKYTKTQVDPELMTESFAWTPPVGARDVTSIAGADDDAGEPDQKHAELVGKVAPDFKLKDLDGKEVKLSDLKGSVVLLDFWATWCGPCRASLPHLDEIYKELKEKGLKAYAVDLREKEDTIKPFIEKTELSIPVLMDEDGKVAKSFGVSGIPQTVVIGKDGKIKKIVVGSGTHEQVRKAIDEAMK